MRKLLIEGGVIANIIEADADFTHPDIQTEDWVEGAAIGYAWVNGAPVAPAEPEPSTDPNDYPLKRYQFLSMVEILNKEQAILDAIAALPATTAVIARKRYDNTHIYYRNDPLFAQLAPAVGLTDADIDAAWMEAKGF